MSRPDGAAVPWPRAAHALVAIRVEHEPDRRVAVCRVAGEVDTYSAGTLNNALTELDTTSNGLRHLVVDLSSVTFFGLAGLASLVQHHARCVSQGVVLSVAVGRSVARRPIELLEMHRVLRIHDTVRQAREAFERPT